VSISGAKVLDIASSGLAVAGTTSSKIAAATNPILLSSGSTVGSEAYGVLTFNNVTTDAGMMGIYAGASGDPDIRYAVPTTGRHILRIAGAGLHIFSATAVTLTGTLSATGAVKFSNYGAGTATFDASGNITSVSDERMKRNIRPFARGLSDILALKPILHGYTITSGLDQTRDDYAGFSAQQVQQFIPEAIGQNKDGMMSFSDRPVLAALVNAVAELKAEIDAIRAGSRR
jgi:hypothetical protein